RPDLASRRRPSRPAPEIQGCQESQVAAVQTEDPRPLRGACREGAYAVEANHTAAWRGSLTSTGQAFGTEGTATKGAAGSPVASARRRLEGAPLPRRPAEERAPQDSGNRPLDRWAQLTFRAGWFSGSPTRRSRTEAAVSSGLWRRAATRAH